MCLERTPNRFVSKVIGVEHGLCERLRGFLRQIVADAASNQTKLILASELLGVCLRLRVRRAVGVALQGDGRHRDLREQGQSFFQGIVFGFALDQVQPPAIVVDRDGDMVGVIERGRAALVGGVVKVPFR